MNSCNNPKYLLHLFQPKFKQMKNLLLVALLCIGSLAEAQITLNNVTLSGKLKTDKSELVLNGGGIRKKAFFKVYVAGLYTTAKSNNADALVNGDQEMAVRLQITSSVVSSSNLSESIREGFTKSTKGNTTAIQSRIDAFIGTFSKEEVKEGDIFTLVYIPGEGVKAFKNGKFQSTTTGMDFKKALFGIWLGGDPVDADLKKGLLGN